MNLVDLLKREPLTEDRIAEIAGVHRGTVRRIINEMNLLCVFHQPVYSPRDGAAILRAINAEQLAPPGASHDQTKSHPHRHAQRHHSPDDAIDFNAAQKSAGR